MWSAGVGAIILESCSPVSVEMDAGASSSFSSRRDTVTTSWLSASARERSSIVTDTVPPASTPTPSMRDVSYPMRVTRMECVPGGTETLKAPDSLVATGPADSPSTSTAASITAAPVSRSVTRPEMVACWAVRGAGGLRRQSAARAPATHTADWTARAKVLDPGDMAQTVE